jgi:hypothetical protein
MFKSATLALASLAAVVSVGAAHAQTTASARLPLIQAADGCGPYGWRGIGGHCHFARYWGRGPYFYRGFNGCPLGAWRTAWGCRWR